MSNKIVIDLDGTLAIIDPNCAYADLLPDKDIVDSLRRYHNDGYQIVIFTSRNMRTYANSVGHINANTLPVIVDWLKKHDIPFDEIHVGKPWCGVGGFYVDDRAIRPSEFNSLSYDDIQELLSVKRK